MYITKPSLGGNIYKHSGEVDRMSDMAGKSLQASLYANDRKVLPVRTGDYDAVTG
jgi:hypothetical protein